MRISIRRRVAAALMSVGLAAGGLLLASAPAGAIMARPVVGKDFGSFAWGYGATVDQSTGNVYVLDGGGTNLVEIFGPNGESPVGGLPSSVNGEGSPAKSFAFEYEPTEPALDSTRRVLYLPDVTHKVVDEYKLNGSKVEYSCEISGYGASGDECQAAGATADGTLFKQPLGTALDTAGDLYIESANPAAIYEYNAAGEDVATYALSYSPQAAAVASSGAIYVIPYANSEIHELKRSSLTGASEGESILPGGGAAAIAFDVSTGNLLVDRGSKVEELNAKHEVIGTTTESSIGASGGLAVDEATNHLYVTDFSYGHVVQFGPTAVLPDVTTAAAAPVERSAATLKGTVNPEGTKTRYWFEYGGNPPSYTGKTAAVEVEGGSPIEVSAHITGLTFNTGYNYRLVAENEGGQNPGANMSFTTQQVVEGLKTNAATAITTASATLNGELEPNGYATSCWFEYENKEWWGYPWQTFTGVKTSPIPVGSASEVKAVGLPLSQLEPNRTYYDRMSCENSFGATNGQVETFTTLAAPPTVLSEASEDVSRKRAVLVAELDPLNSATTYYFEYGLTSGYGYKTAQLPTAVTEGRALVQAAAVELETNATYHYRVVAKNPGGTTDGPDQTFTSGSLTPPLVVTGGASNINPNGATIYGTLNTEGLVSAYGFRVGTSPEDLGPPTGMGSVGAGFAEATVALTLHGLQPHTNYYYRVTAENVDNVGSPTEGKIHSFTTASYPNPNITVQQLRLLSEPFAAWPPAGKVTNTACPQGCAPEIKVLAHSVHGGIATITVRVPSAGRLIASGGGVHRASKTVHQAGTVTMRLRLSKMGQRFLAHHHGRNLVVPITFSFVPSHGEPISARVAVLMH